MSAATAEEQQGKIPITLLSGFLGAGKTTLLREVLQNKGGVRVAVVVNDVAQINIDSKLVRERTNKGGADGLADCIELQNGCACCNASDELMQSIMQLLTAARNRGSWYDRIIIELSGVAEPKNVRREFAGIAEAAEEAGNPVVNSIQLQTMITVVDSPSFTTLFQSKQEIADRADLYMDDKGEETDNERKVVDLLVEQVECADYLILNKTDQCVGGQLEMLQGIVAALNPTATILSCSWGKVPLPTVMGAPPNSKWASIADEEDDLREAITAAKKQKVAGENHGHGHGHGHGHDSSHEGHGHEGHGHEGHGHEGHSHESHDKKDHGHEGHGHEGHSHESHDKKDHGHEGHGHEGHSHGGHSHDGHSHEGHSHEHAHDSKQSTTTAAMKYGITSFVYSRRRPFHPQRLLQVVMYLPVKVDSATGENVDDWEFPTSELKKVDEAEGAVMKTVIRSKGFVWTANMHKNCQYWSHAGHHFELRTLGLWWAATPLHGWPSEGSKEDPEIATILNDFAKPPAAGPNWGDRRQEIVFIGVGMDQAKIEALMDSCILTDVEMQEYEQLIQKSGYKDAVCLDPASGEQRSLMAMP